MKNELDASMAPLHLFLFYIIKARIVYPKKKGDSGNRTGATTALSNAHLALV